MWYSLLFFVNRGCTFRKHRMQASLVVDDLKCQGLDQLELETAFRASGYDGSVHPVASVYGRE